MTLADRLADAQQRSVKLYLQRSQIQEQAQQVRSAGVQLDMALVKLDGEIDLLTALIAEQPKE